MGLASLKPSPWQLYLTAFGSPQGSNFFSITETSKSRSETEFPFLFTGTQMNAIFSAFPQFQINSALLLSVLPLQLTFLLNFDTAYVFITEAFFREKRQNPSRISTGTMRNLLAQAANHRNCKRVTGIGTWKLKFCCMSICLSLALQIIFLLLSFFELFFPQVEEFSANSYKPSFQVLMLNRVWEGFSQFPHFKSQAQFLSVV